MYKIITNKQDSDVTLKFTIIPAASTRGNMYKIRPDHVMYDLRTFPFYRAMHVVLARYCYRMSSVRPSVCPSVCNVDVL